MIIQVLVDNEYSWILPFAKKVVDECNKNGHKAVLIHKHNEVMHGDILCLLSCEKLFRKLELNKHNLVVCWKEQQKYLLLFLKLLKK